MSKRTLLYEIVSGLDTYYEPKTKIEIIQSLLSHGANPNTHNDNGMTPLHAAAQYDYMWRYDYDRDEDNTAVKVVRLLLARGANPMARNRNNETPLEVCIQRKPDLYHPSYYAWEDTKFVLENAPYTSP